MRRVLTLCTTLAAVPVAASEITVPSGQLIVPLEVLTEVHGSETWLILRYVAPAIARNVDYEIANRDIDHLCATDGVRQAELSDGQVDQIVITLMDQPLERGTTNPDVVQFFGGYRLVDGVCILEPF